MVDIFDVLADGTRRDILQRLRDDGGEVSVSRLVAELGISQPTVSKHLKVLRDHELVTVREEGQHRYYAIDAAPLEPVGEWLASFEGPTGGSATVSVLGDGAFSAWAGSEVGDRVGRAAAETAHSARAAFDAAQEKLQGARERIGGRLPRRRRAI